MKKNEDLNELAIYYKEQLADGKIQQAYMELIGYVRQLKAFFSKEQTDFDCGNISQGYLDYTYFPIINDSLRAHKLRFGLVLNHQELQFELWLMGQNAEVQADYWDQLRESIWNEERTEMPQYSFIETIIVRNPDFTDLDQLTREIVQQTVEKIAAITDELSKRGLF